MDLKDRFAKFFFVPGLAVILALLIYSNTFKVPFHFDDLLVIVENPFIKSLEKLPELWLFDPSRFLTHLSFAFNYYFGGLAVEGYHAVNLILHIINTFLFYAFMLVTLQQVDLKDDLKELPLLRIPLFAALLFLVHPIQTQAVTYISQRSTLLATLCYLLALIFYIQARRKGKGGYYAASLCVAFIGLFTKPIIVTLPAAILLYEICFLKKEKMFVPRLLPFFVLALSVPLLLLFWKHKTFDIAQYFVMTKETSKFTRLEYLLTQFNVIVTYFKLLIFPAGQNLDYEFPIARSFFSFPTWLSFSALVSLLWLAVKLFRRERVLAFCIFWIFVTLSLESSVFPISDVINEHRFYLPMAGFAFMVSLLFSKMRKPDVYFLSMVIILVFLSGLTYNRNMVWTNRIGLLEDIISKSPNKARVHNNLGIAYVDKNDLSAAEREYKTAIAIDPDFSHPYNNLANIYTQQGRYQEAKELLNKAVQIEPRYAGAYYNLGNIAWLENDKIEAEKYYLKSIGVKMNFAPAIVALGRANALRGDLDKAEFYYRSAIYFNPGYADAYVKMGDLYLNLKDHAQALYFFQEALKRDANIVSVYNTVGNICDMLGQYGQAEEFYKQAIQRDAGFANAYLNLANTLQKQNRWKEAVPMLEEAQRLYQSQGNRTMAQTAGERLKGLTHLQ